MKDFIIDKGVLRAYSGNEKNIIIPSDVTKIAKQAFKGNTIIESVEFPSSSLQSIDDEAFENCTSLLFIKLPDGLIHIGDKVFAGCEQLKFIVVPSSVLLIGENVFSSTTLLIGPSDSEIAKYASKNNLRYSDKEPQINKSGIKTESTKLINKTFDIFGEKITCSSCLVDYQEIIEHYENIKSRYFSDYMNIIPMTFTAKIIEATPQKILNFFAKAEDDVMYRLGKKSVFADPKEVFTYSIEAKNILLKLTGAIIELLNAAIQYRNETVQEHDRLAFEDAESKVTGLGYGMIGGALDMALYAFDDLRESTRQRKEAYAAAEKKIAEFRKTATSSIEKEYADEINKRLPTIKKIIEGYVDALKLDETYQLIYAGILDQEAITKIDIEKSTQLLNTTRRSYAQDKRFSIAKAIEQYPCNVNAYVYADELQYSCPGLEEIKQFLQLNRRITGAKLLKQKQEEENRKAEEERKKQQEKEREKAELDRIHSAERRKHETEAQIEQTKRLIRHKGLQGHHIVVTILLLGGGLMWFLFMLFGNSVAANVFLFILGIIPIIIWVWKCFVPWAKQLKTRKLQMEQTLENLNNSLISQEEYIRNLTKKHEEKRSLDIAEDDSVTVLPNLQNNLDDQKEQNQDNRKQDEPIQGSSNKWICRFCLYEYSGELPPERCPMCRNSGDIFKNVPLK